MSDTTVFTPAFFARPERELTTIHSRLSYISQDYSPYSTTLSGEQLKSFIDAHQLQGCIVSTAYRLMKRYNEHKEIVQHPHVVKQLNQLDDLMSLIERASGRDDEETKRKDHHNLRQLVNDHFEKALLIIDQAVAWNKIYASNNPSHHSV